MTAIYVLTEGEYSDYHIVALFSTREKAEEAQVLLPDSYVEGYELDALEIPEHPPGYTAWNVAINADKNEINWSQQVDPFGPHFKVGERFFDNNPYRDSSLSITCWARDKEHAEKIALDKFYQWKWEREQI